MTLVCTEDAQHGQCAACRTARRLPAFFLHVFRSEFNKISAISLLNPSRYLGAQIVELCATNCLTHPEIHQSLRNHLAFGKMAARLDHFLKKTPIFVFERDSDTVVLGAVQAEYRPAGEASMRLHRGIIRYEP